MLNWKPLFDPNILRQGYACYQNHAVQTLTMADDCITATVSDDRYYTVKINVCRNTITSMSCTCSDAVYCRHMAAALFASQDFFSCTADDTSYSETTKTWKTDVLPDFSDITCWDGTKNKLSESVQNADEMTVRAFLYAILKEDPSLQNRFFLLTQRMITVELMKQWKQEIDSIFAKAVCGGHIAEDHAMDFTRSLYSFLSSLDLRISDETALGIFKTVDYILSRLQHITVNDANGSLWCLFDFCYQIIGKLLPCCQEKDRLRIFDWASQQLNCTPDDGKWHELAHSCALQLILHQFSGPQYMDKKLALTDKEVQKAALLPDYEQDALPNKIRLHLLLMEQNGCSVAERADYIKQYQHCGTVCLMLSEFYQQHQDDAQAIAVLEETYTNEHTPLSLACECCKSLKELYKKEGCHERYIHMLWDLVLRIHWDNIDVYRELKSQYTAKEWQQEREKIFASWENHPYIGQLYAEEKLYGRLLQYVHSHHRLSDVQQYEGLLIPYYPTEMLQLYTEMLMDMAEQNADRKRYACMVRILRKMQQIPGGPKYVQAIVRQWRQQYKRRRAMMEELDTLQLIQ